MACGKMDWWASLLLHWKTPLSSTISAPGCLFSKAVQILWERLFQILPEGYSLVAIIPRTGQEKEVKAYYSACRSLLILLVSSTCLIPLSGVSRFKGSQAGRINSLLMRLFTIRHWGCHILTYAESITFPPSTLYFPETSPKLSTTVVSSHVHFDLVGL